MMFGAITMSSDDGLVPLARAGDAVGASLRKAYAAMPLPRDMAALLRRLENVPPR